MKTLLPLLFLLVSITNVAQTTNYSGFNYQAVVRDAQGQPMPDQAVGVQFSFTCGGSVYVEVHSTTSDAQGMIALVIGEGARTGGVPTFSAIDWSSCGATPISLSVAMDITGGSNYATVGTQELKAVPFAMRSLTTDGGAVSGWELNGSDLNNTNTGNVGIGTNAPESALDLHGGNLRVTGDGLSAAMDLTPFSPSGNDPGARVQATDDGGFGAHLDFLVKPIGNLTNTLENRMRIESNGNVGIGTTTPVAKLEVRTAGMGFRQTDGTVNADLVVAGTDAYFGTSSPDHHLHLTAGGFDDMIIRGDNHRVGIGRNPIDQKLEVEGGAYFNGNVGIGTSTPASKLDVEGGVSVGTTYSGTTAAPANGAIIEGRVGIGTTTPADKLTVQTATNNYGFTHSDGTITVGSFVGGSSGGGWYGTRSNHNLNFFTNDAAAQMTLATTGNVGIGTTTPQSKLAVNGRITCKEVEVTLTGFPDYVFAKDYRLMPLPEVKQYIAANGHLPNVPSACEVEENGIGLGELNKILLEKVEELTLHLIEKDQEVNALQSEMRELRGMMLELHAK
ncbi:MAG: hypothetical protein IPO87_15150 [Flavobacteriales bacterium]|nr:hypothetical protein [Flavobacteriales bacterium]